MTERVYVLKYEIQLIMFSTSKFHEEKWEERTEHYTFDEIKQWIDRYNNLKNKIYIRNLVPYAGELNVVDMGSVKVWWM